MLAHGNGHGPRHSARLTRWRRWVHMWREDHRRHAAARAEARAHAPIRPGERLLAVACGDVDGLLAATDCALYYQTGRAWARLGWEQVGQVHWDDRRHVLVLTGLTPAVPARTAVHLARHWDLPMVAAERVSWATLVTSGSH